MGHTRVAVWHTSAQVAELAALCHTSVAVCHTGSFATQLHPIVARPRMHIAITQGPNPQIETREASHLTLADEWCGARQDRHSRI